MSSNIKIPTFCQYGGQVFVAQTTTTRYCSKTCNSRHYKQIKREEKVQAAFYHVTEKNPIALLACRKNADCGT